MLNGFASRESVYCTQNRPLCSLAAVMLRLKDCRIVGHVHDEVIIEAEEGTSVEDICAVMGQTPEWIPGLVLRADGYECRYYRKD